MLLSHTSANKSWWFYFHHVSQNCIFLTILISIAWVQGVIIFLLKHKLFCLPPGKLLFFLIRAARTICKSEQAEGARSNEVSMTGYKLFWEGDETHGKVSSIKSHMITVIFYSHHTVPHTSYSSNRKCTVLFSIFMTMLVILFLHLQFHSPLFSCFRRTGFQYPSDFATLFPLKTSKSWRRGKSGYLFPWLLSSQDMVWQ